MATKYNFVTKWKTEAPITQVWEVITKSLEWPQWWHSFESVTELVPGDFNSIGSVRRYTLKGLTGYHLAFDLKMTERVNHQLIRGTSSGDLDGTGTWHFSVKDGITYIEYHWNVSTNVAWMNAMAFLLKPAFKFNHWLVMKKGADYLSKKLGVKVTDFS